MFLKGIVLGFTGFDIAVAGSLSVTVGSATVNTMSWTANQYATLDEFMSAWKLDVDGRTYDGRKIGGSISGADGMILIESGTNASAEAVAVTANAAFTSVSSNDFHYDVARLTMGGEIDAANEAQATAENSVASLQLEIMSNKHDQDIVSTIAWGLAQVPAA